MSEPKRPHWHLTGPGRPVPAKRLLHTTTVRGAHVATLRRVLRIGPWGLWLLRYRPSIQDKGHYPV